MSAGFHPEPWRRSERLTLAGLVTIKLLLHLSLITRYGHHRDELYYRACGRHLAFGYVDHPPLVPWLARLSELLFGPSLIGLRVWALAAGAATVILTVVLCRALGGRWYALLIAGLCVVLAPAFLRMGKMHCIPVLEPVFWLSGSLLLLRIARDGTSRLWLPFGLVFGIGLMNKHAMLLFGPGSLLGLLVTPLRSELRKPWLWLGALIALACVAPNLVWQIEHGWPTLEFLRSLNRTVLARLPRLLFLGGQVLYMHPFTLPVWVAGLLWLLRQRGAAERTLGFVWLGALAVLLVTRGKPYYLAPAYPALFAAGGVSLERWLAGRSWRGGRTALLAWLTLAAPLSLGIGLPILPVAQVDRLTGALFGWVVEPTALTHDFHDEHGWPEQVAAVTEVVATLGPDERRQAVILTSNYGQASAVSHFGAGLPPAVSGHMTYYLWGHGPNQPTAVVAYGMGREQLTPLFEQVEERARIRNPLAMEDDLPIFVCHSPRLPWPELWPKLKRYAHEQVGKP